MTKLLFVDDSSERFEALSENLPENVGFVYWCPTAERAIETLAESIPFSVICLDHDLGKDSCGCEVVTWIVHRAEFFKEVQFFIHSWNPDGALLMHQELRKAGLRSKIKPFSFAKGVT